MSIDEAFEALGIDRECSADELKHAYRQLLKVHKPDRDPVAFRRVRDAYETLREIISDAQRIEEASWASSEARGQTARPRPPASDGPPSSPTTHSEIDADVVFDALARFEAQWAYTLVADDRWARALIDDADGVLAYATYLVACSTALAHRPAMLELASRYPDVFGNFQGGELALLLSVSEEWSEFMARQEIPERLSNFATWIAISDNQRRSVLADKLTRWFWSDVAGAQKLFRSIAETAPNVADFLLGQLERFSEDIETSHGDVPIADRQTPAAVMRPFVVPFAIAAVACAVAIYFQDFGGGLLPLLIKTASVLVFPLVTLYFAGKVFDIAHRRQRLFVEACLAVDLEPEVAALSIGTNVFVRHAIRNNASLSLGFATGRLARLTPPTPA